MEKEDNKEDITFPQSYICHIGKHIDERAEQEAPADEGVCPSSQKKKDERQSQERGTHFINISGGV